MSRTAARPSPTDAEVTVPGELDGHPVRAIGMRAFSSIETLTGVSIPDEVVTIEMGAADAACGRKPFSPALGTGDGA